jgi:RNA polymerase sigma-70 factor (ECF subfamily)
VDETIRSAISAARQRWPAVAFDDAACAQALAARPAAAADFLPEVLLAQACASGVRGAIEAFEREYFGELERAVLRSTAVRDQHADAAQLLRERLFVGAPPRIAEYAGTGPLRLWVRVAALRMVQNLAAKAPREQAETLDSLAELPAAGADPELDHLRRHYGEQFRAAFKAAATALPPEDRLLLEQRFMKRMSQEALAKSYDVHVNTVARWIARARDGLEAGVREALVGRGGIPEAEVTSVLRLVRSQLDVSLGGQGTSFT